MPSQTKGFRVLLVDSRNPQQTKSFTQALLEPSSPTGGLFCFPNIPNVDFKACLHLDYTQLAKVLFGALNLDIEPAILQEALKRYGGFSDIAPLRHLSPTLYVQELLHGPTLAFKDMALQPFGILLSKLAQQRHEKYLILVATSGDTGPASLASFASLPNTYVICLYPAGGTSLIQALQMQTMDAPNLKVFGIKGNFDDAQSTLKALLKDTGFKATLQKQGFCLSVANSINIGRIVFQIIYHVWGYLELVRTKALAYGQPLNILVPSGNFGNALGAFYAKQMGLPLAKIGIVSNANNVLEEWIKTGVYDIRQRGLLKTYAPAMDILKSSNVERLLYALLGHKRTLECMQALEQEQIYSLQPQELQILQKHFTSFSCDDESCLKSIAQTYQKYGYLADPHTATALHAYEQFQSDLPCVVVSTASWSKFTQTTLLGLGGVASTDDKQALEILATQGITPPQRVKELLSRPKIHTEVLETASVASQIQAWLEKH